MKIKPQINPMVLTKPPRSKKLVGNEFGNFVNIGNRMKNKLKERQLLLANSQGHKNSILQV